MLARWRLERSLVAWERTATGMAFLTPSRSCTGRILLIPRVFLPSLHLGHLLTWMPPVLQSDHSRLGPTTMLSGGILLHRPGRWQVCKSWMARKVLASKALITTQDWGNPISCPAMRREQWRHGSSIRSWETKRLFSPGAVAAGPMAQIPRIRTEGTRTLARCNSG